MNTKWSLSHSVALHEGAHDEYRSHTAEVGDFLEDSGRAYSNDPKFSELLVQNQDFPHLVSMLGLVVDYTRSEAEFIITDSESWMEYADGYTTDEYKYEENRANWYQHLADNPLAQDQETWATFIIDEHFNNGFKGVRALGLDREELIDVLAHETSIYPKAHAEYMENLAELQEYLSEGIEGDIEKNESQEEPDHERVSRR